MERVKTGTGEVLDITNTFPLSLLMIAGRIGARMSNGETVDKDLVLAFNQQIAIGQAATDIQFGNDITRMLTLFFNGDPNFTGRLPTAIELGMSSLGNVGAGRSFVGDVIQRDEFVFGNALFDATQVTVTGLGTFTSPNP